MNPKITQTTRANQVHPRHPELDAVAGFHVTQADGFISKAYKKVTEYRHTQGQEAFPSDATIGEMAGGYSRDTVQETKKKLREANWLWWGKKDHAQTPNYYFLADRERFNKFWFLFLLVFGKSDFLNIEKPLQFKDPTLLDIKVKKILYKSTSPSTSRACARDGESSIEALTMESGENFITPSLRQATELMGLTKWGQIRLAAFPNEVIEHANKQFSFAKPANPYNWYFKVCLEYCSANKITPDWDFMKALANKYGMPSKPDFVLPTSRSVTAKASASKTLNEQAGKKSVAVNVKDLFPEYKMPNQPSISESVRNKMETVEMLMARPPESLTEIQKIVLNNFLAELKDISTVLNNKD